MTKTKKLALLAALTAVALTIFVAEAQIPPVVPVPGVLSSSMRPWCSCMACLTIESPSPVPPDAFEWLLSTR